MCLGHWAFLPPFEHHCLGSGCVYILLLQQILEGKVKHRNCYDEWHLAISFELFTMENTFSFLSCKHFLKEREFSCLNDDFNGFLYELCSYWHVFKATIKTS